MGISGHAHDRWDGPPGANEEEGRLMWPFVEIEAGGRSWYPMTKEPDPNRKQMFLFYNGDGRWLEHLFSKKAFLRLTEPTAEDLAHPNPCRSIPKFERIVATAVAWRYRD
jgi:hypothetical protein